MNKGFRITLCIVTAVVTQFLLICILVLLHIKPGQMLMYLMAAFSCGIGSLLNKHLKKKYPTQSQKPENKEQ